MYTSVPQGRFKTFTYNLAVYCESANRIEQVLSVVSHRGQCMDQLSLFSKVAWDKLTTAQPNENSKLHHCQSPIFGHFFSFPGIA